MNAATLTAFREIAENMSRMPETKTARDMALTSHNLDRTGNVAKTNDGRVWLWNDAKELWVS